MLILAASDFHGNFGWLRGAIDRLAPDLMLCPGDWGDPDQVELPDLEAVVQRVHTLSVFGNHDDRPLLERLRNRDDTPVLLNGGEVRSFGPLRIAGISGIWAKTRLGARLNRLWETAHKHDPSLAVEEWLSGRPLPPYVTDEDVEAWTAELATAAVDILITHGCPIGLGDLTPAGGRGGQRCFRLAFEGVKPRLHLCGHLHRLQRDDLADGRSVLNCGDGSKAEGWVIRMEPEDGRMNVVQIRALQKDDISPVEPQ